MFGTIGRIRPKPGHDASIVALMEEWARTQRPKIPGLVVQVAGAPVDRAGELIIVIIVRDEITYRALADSPAQDAWYRRMVEHLEGEPTWEDVAWQTFRADISDARGPA